MNKKNNTICLIDDDESVLKSMKRLLVSAGFNVESFINVDDYLLTYLPNSLLRDDHQDLFSCYILDITMPGTNGMQFQERLNEEGSIVPIIFLTAHADVHLGVEAMKKGALDFLIKPVNEEKLFAALKTAFEQYAFRVKNKNELNKIQQEFSTLTFREKEVMHYIIGGALNREIAVQLHISEKTVKIHRAHIMQKMNLSNPAELGHKCALLGLQPEHIL